MSNHHPVADTQHNKTFTAYVIGFVLSIILTVAAFFLVQKQQLTTVNLYISVAVLALVQLVVQVICFFGLHKGSERGRNLLTFVFTILIVLVVVSGSLWIMYNLNYNMDH